MYIHTYIMMWSEGSCYEASTYVVYCLSRVTFRKLGWGGKVNVEKSWSLDVYYVLSKHMVH